MFAAFATCELVSISFFTMRVELRRGDRERIGAEVLQLVAHRRRLAAPS